MNWIIAIYKGLAYKEFRIVLVNLLFSFKNDKSIFILTRFAKFFNVNSEFKMRLFIFFNLCDWFLKNTSGINFLGLKIKLT